MSATNYILQFAGDVSALVLSDGDYDSDVQRPIGNQPGIGRADLVNKALKQSTYMAAVLAQLIVDVAGASVYDSDSVSTCKTNLQLAINLAAGFPAGTKMVFFQAAAPTYWTKDAIYNDMALRVVSGAGGGIGGTHDFSAPPSTAHVHTGPSHVHAVAAHVHATSGHTLTEDEIPSHVHYLGAEGGSGAAARSWGEPLTAPSYPTAAAGGGDPHTHGDTGSGGDGDTGAGGTANTGSASPTAFAPKYIDVIVCTKN